MVTPINLKIKTYDTRNNAVINDPPSFLLDLNYEELFFFQEEDNIYATFWFDSSHVSIAYENSTDGSMTPVESGCSIHLSSGKETGDPPAYCPGRYLVQIVIDGRTADYFFSVEPSKTNLKTVMDLRKYVNDFYNGLSENFLRQRTGAALDGSENSISCSKLAAFLEKNMPVLLNYVRQYLNSGYTETVKHDIVAGFSGKINARSIRWLAQKGAAYNSSLSKPDVILRPRIEHNYDNAQNQMFRRELLFWNRELAILIRQLSSVDQHFSMLAERQSCKYVDLSSRIAKESNSYEKQNYIKAQTQCRQDLASYQSNQLKASSSINQLRHYKASLEHILNSTWVKDVSEQKSSVPVFSDNRLRMIAGIRSSYQHFVMQSAAMDGSLFFEKSTPKLFETYLYVILIRILQEDGYQLESVNAEEDDLAVILSNPSLITLRKQNDYADIIYDMDLQNCYARPVYAQYVTINSNHNRPDFIVSFRNHDGSRQAVTIDAKWRKFNYLYDPQYPTKVMEQITDYLLLGYYDPDAERKLDKNGVSRSIAVYPDTESEKVTEVMDDSIEMIGIYPSSYIDMTEGYANLKKQILSVRSSQEE